MEGECVSGLAIYFHTEYSVAKELGDLYMVRSKKLQEW